MVSINWNSVPFILIGLQPYSSLSAAFLFHFFVHLQSFVFSQLSHTCHGIPTNFPCRNSGNSTPYQYKIYPISMQNLICQFYFSNFLHFFKIYFKICFNIILTRIPHSIAMASAIAHFPVQFEKVITAWSSMLGGERGTIWLWKSRWWSRFHICHLLHETRAYWSFKYWTSGSFFEQYIFPYSVSRLKEITLAAFTTTKPPFAL